MWCAWARVDDHVPRVDPQYVAEIQPTVGGAGRHRDEVPDPHPAESRGAGAIAGGCGGGVLSPIHLLVPPGGGGENFWGRVGGRDRGPPPPAPPPPGGGPGAGAPPP